MKKNFIFFIPLVFWTFALLASLLWNLKSIDQNTIKTVRSIGFSFFKEIETTRLWNARHGGVYVPVTEKTVPNPYLKVPDRDIITQKGQRLTKINPAFMTRQIAEIAEEENNIQFHITSLKPIRPGNKPDPWEVKALKKFESGTVEVLEHIEPDQVYRYMAPLFVKKACLTCHEEQGYKLDDIRGGISVTIPSFVYNETAQVAKMNITIIHFVAFAAGFIVLIAFKKIREKQISILNAKNLELSKEIDVRIKTEDSLRKAKIMAETANRTKSAFLSNMSHELRTPLNAILGFSQLLYRSKILNSQQKQNIGIIRKSGEHLLRLINNVLDMSKIEAGHLSLDEKDFDLHRLLNDVEDICQFRAQQKNLPLNFEIEDNLPKFIKADELRLRQVLINLINNAIKFTDKGQVLVNVKRINEDIKNVGEIIILEFKIQDTGVGIDNQELTNLFEPFTQTQAGKNSLQGTGLGLSISHKLVELMGGRIKVQSKVNHGSCFTFNIKSRIAAPIPQYQINEVKQVISVKPGQPKFKILIVDDRETNRSLIVQLLKPLGFAVKEAANGQQAIEEWQGWQPDLILMDMRMPVMDGYTAANKIKSSKGGKKVVVIALTASTYEEEQVIIISTQCDDFLRKPFQEYQLFDLLTKHLGVQFQYENEIENLPESSISDEVLFEELRDLPIDVLLNLNEGLGYLKMDLLYKALLKIEELKPEFTDNLRVLINNFEYQKIENQIIKALKR